jgi:hypothetical protein
VNRQYEDALADCLEAIAQGQCSIDECLARYPQWARRLEPLLRVAVSLGEAYADEPSPARQADARQRFLAAARARQTLALGPRRPLLAIPWPPRLPGPALRPALAAVAVAVLVFVGFSSFTLATAGDALPGDWQYPVKRFTERARLAFVFGEDARRGYRIGLAEERVEEVEGLVARERRISEPVLRELASSTGSLVEALDPASVPEDHIERIGELTAKQQDVLDDAEPLVEEEATDELEEAMVVSSEGHARAVQALALARSAEEEAPEEAVVGEVTPTPGSKPSVTPGAGGALPPAEASPEPSPMSSPLAGEEASEEPLVGLEATPEPTVASEAPAEPAVTEVPQGQQPTPTPVVLPPTEEQETVRAGLVSLPHDRTGGIAWNYLVIGGFSMAVPAEEDGWVVSSPLPAEEELGSRLRGVVAVGYLEDGRATVAVMVTVADGNARIYAEEGDVSGEIDAAQVERVLSGPKADIVLHILGSINIVSS